MSAFGRLLRKLAALAAREQFQAALDEEMSFHRDQMEQQFRDECMTADDALYAAMRHFGNATRLKERSEEVVSFRLETVAQDLANRIVEVGHDGGDVPEGFGLRTSAVTRRDHG